MRSKRKHRESEVSTDSLNDIMFFLLLFFLILSTMVSPNAIKVNLPKATPNVTVENEKKPIHLAVTKDRNFFLNNTPINKTELKTKLEALTQKNTNPTVLMHLDKELSIQDEIDIMTICYELKCKTVLATAATQH